MKKRISLIVIVILFSALSAYFGRPLVHENSDAIMVMVTIITVFAGFLVAVTAIVSDPSMFPAGSWRKVEVLRNGVEAKIIRNTWLFRIYLIALGLLFAGALVLKDTCNQVPEFVKEWIERGYLFFGVMAFLFTFGLPNSLWKLQMAKIDAEIRRRRTESGIEDAN